MGDEATKGEPMTCDPMIKEPTKLTPEDRMAIELAKLRGEKAELLRAAAGLQVQLAQANAQLAAAEAQRLTGAADAAMRDVAQRYAIDPATQSIDLATGEIRSKKP
jgi:hypothetical protein